MQRVDRSASGVCCSVLQCVAVCWICAIYIWKLRRSRLPVVVGVLQCVAEGVAECVACVLQCVAVCCSVLQCVGSVRYTYGNTRHLDCQLGGVCCSVLQRVEQSALQSAWQCAAVCCIVMRCVAVCSSVLQVLQRVAACCIIFAVCCRAP